MQKFLLSSFGIVSVLLVAAAVGLAVQSSYKQVEEQGRALGAATAVTATPEPEPTIATPTPEPVNTEGIVIAQDVGAQNPTLARKTISIFKRKDLQVLWDEVYGATTTAPPMPVVDFTKNAVIAVLAGKQPETYKVSFTGLEATDTNTLVKFDETVPADTCPKAPETNSPFILVQVPNAGKTFKTVFNTTQSACN